MNLSLVMATVGRREEVGRMIRSLASQDTRAFELIVIDQNADDRLEPEVSSGRAAGLDIRHERLLPPDQGAARNRGIALARHEAIGFPDDDCWYESSVVSGILKKFSADRCDGVVARWHEEDPRGAPPHRLAEEKWRRFREVKASMIAQFFTKDLLVRLSGFDPRLGLSKWYGGSEETELVFRALRQGFDLQYCPDIVVHHPISDAVPSGELWQACRHIRSRARGLGAVYAKHRLSPYVICRGFLAPMLKSLIPPRSIAAIVVGGSVSLGRIEGFLRWRFCER